MPPASPAGAQVARSTTLDRAQRVRFRRAVALMVMTVLVPGSAQLVAGNRRVGRIATRVWLALIATALLSLVVSYFSTGFAFWAVSNTLVLGVVRLALMALAVGWALLFMDAWRLGQPLTLHQRQRLAVVGVNGLLCFSVAGALLFGAHMVGVQRHFMLTMFSDGEVVGAHEGRFNVLLLGGDSGAGRWGLRPDSLTVASIDARTGKTVLVGLPRNMSDFPFADGSVMAEQFPKGFDCDECYLNGVSTWAQDNPELFKGSKAPGVDATVMAVEGITGLEINYWSMVNLKGFRSLVDAVGGVTLNVRDRIPVGLPHDSFYRFIEPGTRKLNGEDTLWFARARDGSDDYSRMARQKCVMNAMLQQVSPQDALRNFSAIAEASAEMVSTNVPGSEVDTFLDLALKAKSQPIATVSLVPPKVVTADPDIDVVHAMVAAAVDRAEGEKPTPAPTAEAAAGPEGDATSPAAPIEDPASTPATAPATEPASIPAPPPSMTGGSIGSLKEGYAANEAEDLGSAC
ncbi:MAG: Cell envelope-related transcriptional attenuator [uncultured Nocardioides sp.]|uniref:Cell envelope-related transcriptional attenuator n=1 Tax=uncultured Nocardioides sp. TaxID=198441 RepID=A0A6J4NHT2_9ACTN|nr:MAG: Cell envelope-related transcriptional attenuator [uncultured Nocardioides sp.]